MHGSKASKANVRQVQEALKAQGHDPGPIDGVMGPQTQQALRVRLHHRHDHRVQLLSRQHASAAAAVLQFHVAPRGHA